MYGNDKEDRWKNWLFRWNVATHSEARWPLVPINYGQSFRRNLATPEGIIEAALDNPC